MLNNNTMMKLRRTPSEGLPYEKNNILTPQILNQFAFIDSDVALFLQVDFVDQKGQRVELQKIDFVGSSLEIKIEKVNLKLKLVSNTFDTKFGSVTQLNQYIQKRKRRMNSYQSTIDSQSDSNQHKCQEKASRILSLRRNSKKTKVNRIFKIQNQPSKIQIQHPFPNAKNFNPEVRDYAQDIISYVKTTQSQSVIPENYISWQSDINSNMREILVGWIVEVSSGLGLKLETLHMAVLLIDKYCYERNILKRKYQVLGGACLYIAAKYQEITTPRLKRFVEISDGAYAGEELLYMESDILLTLKFNLKEKSTLTFFQIKCEEYDVPKSVVGLGYFLLEMCLIEYEFCKKRPTYLSLAIVYSAMKMKKKKVTKPKVFISQNLLDEDVFTTYLNYVDKLYAFRHLPKFSPVRKRYSILFTLAGELK